MLVNLLLALLLATAFLIELRKGTVMEPEEIVVGTLTAVLVLNSLRRQRPEACDTRLIVWCICGISLFYFLAFELPTNEANRTFYLAFLTLRIGIECCLVYLGRSFAILPARRMIKMRFLYRYVRHPVYAMASLSDSLFLLYYPSWTNFMVLLIGAGTFWLRAKWEERLLSDDRSYIDYKKRTPFRFIPLVY